MSFTEILDLIETFGNVDQSKAKQVADAIATLVSNNNGNLVQELLETQILDFEEQTLLNYCLTHTSVYLYLELISLISRTGGTCAINGIVIPCVTVIFLWSDIFYHKETLLILQRLSDMYGYDVFTNMFNSEIFWAESMDLNKPYLSRLFVRSLQMVSDAEIGSAYVEALNRTLDVLKWLKENNILASFTAYEDNITFRYDGDTYDLMMLDESFGTMKLL